MHRERERVQASVRGATRPAMLGRMPREPSSRVRIATIAVVVVVVLAAGVGGWLLGRGSESGQRVDSLAEAIALANAGKLPPGTPSDRERRSTTTTSGAASPIIARAVVTDKHAESGHDVIVLSTRTGDITLRTDQIAEIAGLEQVPSAAGEALPVGAHVLLFQSTFGPGAKGARDYRIAVLPPGFGG
jgi:hypothetical protein